MTDDFINHQTITMSVFNEPPPDPDLDSDGDGWTDAEDIAAGTDPFDPNDYPTDPVLQDFEWTTWVIIILIIAIIVAIILFIVFGGGLMGGVFALIAFAVLAVVAWMAGAGLLMSNVIIATMTLLGG